MLVSLTIKNLAVIKNVNINFYQNLNVFSGETGAGKSVMLKAINFILGARCSKSMIRFGEKSAEVEAVFNNLPKNVTEYIINDLKIKLIDNCVLIRRKLFLNGKTLAYFNNIGISISDLKKVGLNLVHFNEQNSGQNLLFLDNELKILDNFAEINDLVLQYRISYNNLKNLILNLKKLENDIKNKNEKLEVFNDQIKEIESLNLKIGEDEKIEKELKIAQNSSKIFEILNLIINNFYGSNSNEGILNFFKTTTDNLSGISNLNDSFMKILNKFNNIFFELEELILEIKNLVNKFDFDREYLEFLENRLSKIIKIKRKFGPSLELVLNKLDDLKFNCLKFENYSEQKIELNKLKKIELDKFKNFANLISQKRKIAADKLSIEILNELKFLEMKDANFKVELKPHKANLNGLEDVEFLISTNLGEPLKPITKIASGGELSRIMLAAICVMANKFKTPTLIFDEIDYGVSGVTATRIGSKIKNLSKHCQIICITHIAQIVAIADENFKISKDIYNNETKTKIEHLNLDDKIKEVARIIGGDNVSDLTLKLANELINSTK